MLDRQYMLGDALMVVPVMDADGRVEYFLPDGSWIDFVTGEKKQGGRWLREQYDYMGLPLLARENTVVPMGARDDVPDYELADGVTFHVFEVSDGSLVQGVVPDSRGVPATVVNIARAGSRLTITPGITAGDWSVLLRSMGSATSVEGATVSNEPEGVRLIPSTRDAAVVVTLE
jgi:alpha-D-xyloside xylohydrolase